MGIGGLIVPAYFHPAVEPGDWDDLVANAERLRLVVVNLADGPGDLRDPSFDRPLIRLAEAGVPLAGYVDTDYGRRPAATVVEETRRWREWFDIGRVFLDRVTTAADVLPECARLVAAVRETGAHEVALNHGAPPADGYHHLAELLGTFEGPGKDWLYLSSSERPKSDSSGREFHLVHSMPANLMSQTYPLAKARNVGLGYWTIFGGSNPFRRLSLPG